MARFRVGQRVRVKYWRLGYTDQCEGVITEIGPWSAGEFHFGIDKYLVLDADCIVKTLVGELTAPIFDQLEPILPSGHQPAELTVEELMPFLKTREVSDVAV